LIKRWLRRRLRSDGIDPDRQAALVAAVEAAAQQIETERAAQAAVKENRHDDDK
jgi:hypothetical protein